MNHKMRAISHCAMTLAATLAAGIGTGAKADTTSGYVTQELQNKVKNIVFIYAENRSFDNLYGNFPGAHGLGEVLDNSGNPLSSYIPQLDRDGATVLPKLPQTWGGVTAVGNPQVVTQAQSDNLPNGPFPIETAFTAASGVTLSTFDVTRDIAHRFFENQMEINGGSNDMYAAWEDAGGLTMGHFDYSKSALYKLAQQYTLADNFFQAAYGGSFLNHQYLICACAPTVTADYVTNNKPSVNVLGPANAKGVPQLVTNSSSPASALTGAPSFQSGNIAPLDYFGAGDGYRAVNTMQPPYQPSGNKPVDAAGTDLLYANPGSSNTLPPQTQTTIGDQLTAAGISWKWYAGAWDAATADGTQDPSLPRTVIYTPSTPRGAPDYQAHHAPFNYYAAFDPVANADYRAAHLQDYNDLIADAAAGTLPAVSFYKPQGNYNQHPGYANADDGDAHVASVVAALQASPQWANMVIVITYDEYGGQWDHVAPPKGDLLGPGTRIPALIISPLSRQHTVDHTQYDTASILRLIDRRYGLSPLSGLTARDAALVNNGGVAMGDITNALHLLPQGPTMSVTPTWSPRIAQVSWTPVAGSVAHYNVYVGTKPGGEGATPVKTTANGRVKSAWITGLTPGQTYYFTVNAVLASGEPTDPSVEASLTMPPPKF